MEATNNIKYQLSVQRPKLSRFGTFSIENLDIQNLSDIGTQKTLRTLKLTNSKILSLSTLPSQPNLERICADNCQINSYEGLSRHPRLKSISFQNTPISNQPNFRLSCIIVIGNRLSLINGIPVTNKEKLIASQYPLIARYLIEAGWEVRYPVPTHKEFCQYAQQYKSKLKGIDPNIFNERSQKYFKSIPFFISNDSPQIIYKEDEIEEEDLKDQDLELANQLRKIIRKKLGINIGNDCDLEEIKDIIRELSQIVQQLDSCQDEIFGIE